MPTATTRTPSTIRTTLTILGISGLLLWQPNARLRLALGVNNRENLGLGSEAFRHGGAGGVSCSTCDWTVACLAYDWRREHKVMTRSAPDALCMRFYFLHHRNGCRARCPGGCLAAHCQLQSGSHFVTVR